MNKIELLDVPHANMRDEQGRPIGVTIVKEAIFSWYFSPASKSLTVMGAGGSMIPVLMTPDQFTQLYMAKPEDAVQKDSLVTEQPKQSLQGEVKNV